MASSIINSDDGSVSGTTGLKTTGGDDGELILQTNGADSVTLSPSAVVINESGADVDFRIESDTNTHALFVDAGNNRVGILESAPEGTLHVNGVILGQSFVVPDRKSLTSGGVSDANVAMYHPLFHVSSNNSAGQYLHIKLSNNNNWVNWRIVGYGYCAAGGNVDSQIGFFSQGTTGNIVGLDINNAFGSSGWYTAYVSSDSKPVVVFDAGTSGTCPGNTGYIIYRNPYVDSYQSGIDGITWSASATGVY